jgi:hypothetical protein
MCERRLSDSSRMCHLLQVLARTSTVAVAFVLLGYPVLLRRSRSVWLQVQRHIQVFVERDLCSLNRLFFRIIATTARPRERNISRAWHLTSAVAFVTSAFAVHPWNGDCNYRSCDQRRRTFRRRAIRAVSLDLGGHSPLPSFSFGGVQTMRPLMLI